MNPVRNRIHNQNTRRENTLAHQRCAEANQVLAKSLDGVSLRLFGKALPSAQVIRTLVLHLRNQDGIDETAIRLSLNVQKSTVRANGTILKVVVKINIGEGTPKLCDDVPEVPLL